LSQLCSILPLALKDKILEAIQRTGQGSRFAAAAAGFEYTFGNVRSGGADVGLLLEDLWDERSERFSAFEDDLFLVTRLALNDVQSSDLLTGAIIDRSSGSTAFLLEASRRVGENWKIEAEARGFLRAKNADDPFYAVRKDGHV